MSATPELETAKGGAVASNDVLGLALKMIFDERQRQDKKWGEQNHKPLLWIAILAEEVGELSKAALHEEFGGPDADNVMLEAVQCAAVSLAIIESILRNKIVA